MSQITPQNIIWMCFRTFGTEIQIFKFYSNFCLH